MRPSRQNMGPMPMTTDSHSLLLLLNWMSPTFPIGSFAYSHGLEAAIAEGDVSSEDDVLQWIADIISTGSGWTDALLFASCWTLQAEDVNALALALSGSKERHQETTQLGRNFTIAASIWTGDEKPDGDVAYPVAAGHACAACGVPRETAAMAFLQGFCAALVSVAVRLVPLGQTSGLKVLRALSPVIAETAARACNSSLADLGSNTMRADIASMRHEILEPRIFRT